MNQGGFNSVSILGVGLIGGSLALALKEKGLAKVIIGYGRDDKRLKEALSLGIIDKYTLYLEEAAKSELVVLATPLGIFEKIAEEISPFLESGTILIDVGSVKEYVVKSIEPKFPESIQFIGTHPIAGSDKTGFEHARKNLFQDARVIITPTKKTTQEALDKVTKMWHTIGAFVEYMSAEEHDKIYALVSHLPHLISFCLVNTVEHIDKNLIKYAGSGFKDTTRIAKSSPDIWKDIFLMNRENVLKMLDVFIDKVAEVRKLLSEEKSEDKIVEFIQKAKNLREELN